MIAIVDYGVGNLFSLSSSVRSLGAEVRVTRDAVRPPYPQHGDKSLEYSVSSTIHPISDKSCRIISCVCASPLAPQASCMATGISSPFACCGSPIFLKISQIPITCAPILSFSCFIQVGQPAMMIGSPSLASSYFSCSFTFSVIS